MATGTTSRLSGLEFVNPQNAGAGSLVEAFRTIPAGGTTGLPG
jgi:hypothetical protein